jgi:small subunit ribosomal protein S9
LTETPENNEPTPEEPEAAPTSEDAGATPPAGEGDEQAARASSAADATSGDAETEPGKPDAEAVVTEDPIVEQPALEATEPAAESPEEPAAEAPSAAAEPAAETPDEEVEVAPRQKPEIPGADLEVLLPEEEQYLDAEAQAAAEAEAEAAAERARAEAEDEQSKPIADAAIDLGAGARYTATGKRKTAVARVILKPGSGEYVINGTALETFFPRDTLQRMIRQPLETVGYEARMDVVARMHGGGVSAQAGALRHGISRALIEADPNLRGELKRRGYLTRDPRVKERKKAGLKKARKRPQFSKR